MNVQAIKTRLVHAGEILLDDLLSESIKTLPEKSVVAVSSKVVALCENRVVPLDAATRDELIARESQMYLDPKLSLFGHHFTIASNTLVASAGIDQSNSDGNWVLWPRDLFASVNQARVFLKQHFDVKHVGVIITDGVSYPLRRGASGVALSWSGFQALKNSIGQPDLFGRTFAYEVQSVLSGLAASANLVMGEADQQTPLAVISDIDFVEFTGRAPTQAEIKEAIVPLEEDLYYPFWRLAPWQKGNAGRDSSAPKWYNIPVPQ
jgi:F420-0:gamma-glutamyl ligase